MTVALADAYECGHCNSTARVTKDERGISHLWISHDDGCPVLAGTLPAAPDLARAADAAASDQDPFGPKDH
ncbi:hypothetical protein [Streptomyces sp. GESEQ-35]|uniref:hypothetical protein n=1 Tax=Streptomyces sp. GESEQ-35 TaxID=2812657 RepID=UPI001B336365|nr:hypothetical protein [Streptomyces sp. GESEQ-35]